MGSPSEKMKLFASTPRSAHCFSVCSRLTVGRALASGRRANWCRSTRAISIGGILSRCTLSDVAAFSKFRPRAFGTYVRGLMSRQDFENLLGTESAQTLRDKASCHYLLD